MKIEQSEVSLDRMFEYFDQQVAAAEAANKPAPVRAYEPDPMHDFSLEVRQSLNWLLVNLFSVPPKQWNEEQGELFNEIQELQERFNA